jgi:hypothetical protein
MAYTGANSVGEQIMQLIMAALNAPSDKPRTTVRNRVNPVSMDSPDAGETPASGAAPGLTQFLLYAVRETVDRQSNQSFQRERTVRIEIVVAGAPPLDAAADPLYLWIVQTLMSDTALWQSITNLEEVQTLWETESSYEDASVCAVEFKVTYLTTIDPAVPRMAPLGS